MFKKVYKNMKKLKHLLVRLTEEEHKKIKIEAIERNMTMSKLVKQAITIYLLNYNK